MNTSPAARELVRRRRNSTARPGIWVGSSPPGTRSPSQGTPFRWNTGTPTTGIASSTPARQDLETFTPDTNGQDVLQFLRGSNAQEVRNGGQFRNRTHKLGDIVSSDPLYIGAPSSNNQSASYVAFAQTYATRPPMIYVGANDGMLHAFSATTGNEMFAYIPTGVFANLIELVNPYYNAVHQFYVNGSPQASDVQFSDNSWHTVLVGTEAQGGGSVFALDVTNPAAITTESQLAADVLWDFTDADMGLGFSTPALTNTADGWQVFFGNGYNSPNQKPYLYALNPQTGALTTRIDLCAAVSTACNLTKSNGLSTVIAVNSSGQLTQYSNLVYAGDLQGNLWRVNISNPNPALWTVTVMFQARDASNNIQPITTSPVATLNPRYPAVLGTMVYFVTGQLLGTPDLATTQVQTIYGIFDPAAGYSTPLQRTSSALEDEPLSYAYSNSAAYIVTGNALSIPTQEGWYIDLNLPACTDLLAGPNRAYPRTRSHGSSHGERRRVGAHDLSAKCQCLHGGRRLVTSMCSTTPAAASPARSSTSTAPGRSIPPTRRRRVPAAPFIRSAWDSARSSPRLRRSAPPT